MTQAMRRAARAPERHGPPLRRVGPRAGYGARRPRVWVEERHAVRPVVRGPSPTARSVHRVSLGRRRVNVLIGATVEETRFFSIIDPAFSWLDRLPLLGARLSRLLVRFSSHFIYQGPARAFARRHARSGGRAYEFRVNYQPLGSSFGAAHVVDLPLLLGTWSGWSATPLLGQASWEEVHQIGRQVRQLWADFARTGCLPAQVELPGVLRVRQVLK